MFAVAGPDAVCLRTPVEIGAEGGATASAAFTVREGERVGSTSPGIRLTRAVPSQSIPCIWSRRRRNGGGSGRADASTAVRTEDVVHRSLITLKALTYSPTGAIVAALTTSLPEEIGGERNWDYRYCWLRDGAFTLIPLVRSGYLEEAMAWRDWLLRAIAGDLSQLQLMYGIGGEHRLTEAELPWLPGYEGSKPVRIGNAASEQFQWTSTAKSSACCTGHGKPGCQSVMEISRQECASNEIISAVENLWREPDEGIWEVRGQRQHFTYSKVSAWTAVDRAIRYAEGTGMDAPLERWRRVRDEIHAEVCAKGFDAERNTFVQYYGGKGLDASLLLIPISGFLPGDDPVSSGRLTPFNERSVRPLRLAVLDGGGG